MTLNASKLGLNRIPAKVIEYDIEQAEAELKEGHYASSLLSIAPLFTHAKRAGKHEKLPDNILKMYFPMPKKYYYYVVGILPASVKKLSPQEIKCFILTFFAIMHRESKFNPRLVNPTSGARGLVQLMPATAKGEAKKLGISRYDLLDPHDNMLLGVNYLAELWTEHGGINNSSYIMSCWNYGPGNTHHLMTHNKGKTLVESLKKVSETDTFRKEVILNYSMYDRFYGKGALKSAYAVTSAKPKTILARTHETKPKIVHVAVKKKEPVTMHDTVQTKATVKVNIGSYSTMEAAMRFKQEKGFLNVNINKVMVNGRVIYRVNVGFVNELLADAFIESVKKLGISGAWKSV